MGKKSRDRIYGSSIRAGAELAAKARKDADRVACDAWNKRMLGYQGSAQPSPTIGDALNAGYGYLEVRRLGCDTHQTVALDIVRRPKTTPIHELGRIAHLAQLSAFSALGATRFVIANSKTPGGGSFIDASEGLIAERLY